MDQRERKPSSLVESGEVGTDRLEGETREGKPEAGPSHSGSHPYLGALAALPICRGFNHPPDSPAVGIFTVSG